MTGDIFTQSHLDMSSVPLPQADLALSWGSLLTNRILVVVAVLLLLANLPNFFRIFPDLMNCLWRPRGNASLEHSANLARMRNMTAMVFIIPVCLIAARYELYNPEFFSKVNPLWHAPMVIGMLIAYVLFRHLLFLLFKPGRMHAEVEDTMHHVLYTFFCILATIMLATIVVVRIAGIPEATVRTVLIWETAVVFFLSLIRTGQIFAQHINGFSTILYLCILELIPAAAVVASAIIF